MRQRKVKNLKEKLNRVDAAYIRSPEKHKGRWAAVFSCESTDELILELGCGKGNFLIAHARKNPHARYIGIEGQESVVLRALEKLESMELTNVRFCGEFVNDIEAYFAENELDGLFINFCDPWPKDRHAKRRLTHRTKLQAYKRILKPGGFIQFKTDNDPLFEFSLSEIEACGFTVEECTRDLHHSADEGKCYAAAAITTEYEEKFRAVGKSINYVRLRLS